jgi:hypothetical protein
MYHQLTVNRAFEFPPSELFRPAARAAGIDIDLVGIIRKTKTQQHAQQSTQGESMHGGRPAIIDGTNR